MKKCLQRDYNPPYTDGGIEKASKNLVAFEKTKKLEPGASQTVKIEIDEDDMTTYDQIFIPKTLVGDQAKFLLEGTDCVVSFHDGPPLSVELPASVVLTVTHTEPGLQGNRSNAGTKPATVETGAEIQVPLFIGEGEKVKVNTTDGSYLGREN